MSWIRYLTPSALERRVFLVALASLVPVAIFSFAILLTNAREQRGRLLQAYDDTMLALMSAVDSELKSAIASLDVLAASPRLARGDFVALREEALELMARRQTWLNVVVSDRSRQIMNARLTEDAALPRVVASASVDEVMRTRRARVGDVLFAPVLRTHSVAVQIPYERDGEVRYVLTALLRPDALLQLLTPQSTAQPGVIGVFDRQHRVVARSLNHAQVIGKPASPGLVRLLSRPGLSGVDVTSTLEGHAVYTVFRRSEFSGWSCAVGIPMKSVDGPVTRSYFVFGGSLVLSVMLGLLTALLVGKTIVGPMRELEEQATLVGRGQTPTMPASRLPEVRQVAVALAAAHLAREAAFRREHEARLAAEQASKAKDEFLAMLGHELRNPLSAITNAAQLIEQGKASLDARGAAAVAIIGRQARHLARLTDDLLDAGRVILGKISLTRAPIDLALAVRTAVDSLKSTGRFALHQVSMQLDEVRVYGDATRIDQIVSNLLTNAIKYTPNGGHIRVSTRREDEWAVIEVTDNGIGLDPELLGRVFELFVQGERALDRSQGGLGIGLTLVRRLAELHGGTAMASSAGSGQGATFTVKLPALDAGAQIPVLETPAHQALSHDVALVEDNDDARSSLRMLLELEDHRVHEARDGPEGVKLLTSQPQIRIAFIDIGLPGLSGYEVAETVRASRGRDIRLVAMSGYGGDQDVERGERAGFDAYIVKPAAIERVHQELGLLSVDRQART